MSSRCTLRDGQDRGVIGDLLCEVVELLVSRDGELRVGGPDGGEVKGDPVSWTVRRRAKEDGLQRERPAEVDRVNSCVCVEQGTCDEREGKGMRALISFPLLAPFTLLSHETESSD